MNRLKELLSRCVYTSISLNLILVHRYHVLFSLFWEEQVFQKEELDFYNFIFISVRKLLFKDQKRNLNLFERCFSTVSHEVHEFIMCIPPPVIISGILPVYTFPSSSTLTMGRVTLYFQSEL